MQPHTIRLQGPWQYRVVEDRSAEPLAADLLAGEMRLPDHWPQPLEVPFRGTVRCRRTFNWPTVLSRGEHVLLLVEGEGVCAIALNGQPLAPPKASEGLTICELTSILEPHNELLIDINCDGPRGGWLENAVLAITE